MTKTFVQDRNSAFFSLDEKKIRAFCKKYNKIIPDNPVVFWAAVYKSVLAISDTPADVRKKAEDWLDSHGFIKGLVPIDYLPKPPEPKRYSRDDFEHKILPHDFYEFGERLLNWVIDGDRRYMACMYNDFVKTESSTSFKASAFNVLRRQYGSSTIVRIELPKATNVLECRHIYLCFDSESKKLMYFTSELSKDGAFFLCAWTKSHAHLLFKKEHVLDEFDRVAELFQNLAGYEPMMEAMM